MMREIALAELVLDQAVGGGGVRHAQKRFGENHERQPFLGGERIFAQDLLDTPDAAASRADGVDEPERRGVDLALDGRRRIGAVEEDPCELRIVRRESRRKGRNGAGGRRCFSGHDGLRLRVSSEE